MTKSFYDYDANNPADRLERYAQFPELSKFHMALQDELTDDEYQIFFDAEKQLLTQVSTASPVRTPWIA